MARSTSGTSGTFGWAGEQRDLETGFSHLRARPYAPGHGCFESRDALSPSMGGTQGWQPYAFAGNCPVSWADPSDLIPGETDLAETDPPPQPPPASP